MTNEEILTSLIELEKRMNEKLKTIDGKLDELEASFERVEKKLETNFERMGSKLDNLRCQLSLTQEILVGIERKIKKNYWQSYVISPLITGILTGFIVAVMRWIFPIF